MKWVRTKPVTFPGRAVRAMLDGEKTQARRVARVEAPGVAPDVFGCPYGQPGDLLWCREIFRVDRRHGDVGGRGLVRYRAAECGHAARSAWWVPPALMPRWASRLTLELTEVRVQRLHDVNGSDCRAEGVGPAGDPAAAFARLWESSHGAGSWGRNPFVWALTFRPYARNVDAHLAATGGRVLPPTPRRGG